MRSLAYSLAVLGAFALVLPAAPVGATIETVEAKAEAAQAAAIARDEMLDDIGDTHLKPGEYRWLSAPDEDEPVKVIISLNDQMAYVYGGDELIAVSTVSSGKPGKETPTGIFPILEKRPMYHSRKYDNAPMPFMQRIDQYGIALHAGHVAASPASHGCVRLPAGFAKKLYSVTSIGSTVMIGA